MHLSLELFYRHIQNNLNALCFMAFLIIMNYAKQKDIDIQSEGCVFGW